MRKGKRELTKKTKKTGSHREIERKKKKIIKFFFSMIAIAVIFILMLIINNFVILDYHKKTNLIINNKNITANLKNDIIIEDNIIYLSKNDISNFFDKYIYKDESTNQIITTYEKKIAAIGYDKNKITINGSEKNTYAHVINKNDVDYLPISEMKDVYNIEIENIEKSKTITMDSIEREQKKAIVKSGVSVKATTNFITRTVDKIKKGACVIVVSSDGKYTKIRTEKGKVGYIKSNKLENEFTVRENLEEDKQIDGKVNLVWDYFSTYASAPKRNDKIQGVNVVSPAFFYLDQNGELKENIGNAGKEYIQWAHDNGYKVWPMVSNAEAAQKSLSITSNIMNNYQLRQNMIEKIVDSCVKYKLDGINIDFENMKQEDKDMFSRFIIELTPRLKEIGLVTSVDVTAPDGGETWSMCFDRNVIGNVADYIAFMAYDEYGVSSNKPGTTAGYDWVKLSLNKFLQTEEINSKKIILGVPFYTRIWTSNQDGQLISKNTVSIKKLQEVLPENIEKKWDENLRQNYVELTDNNNKKQIWIEDLKSLKEKISLINENDLAGVGCWQKDMETEEVWQMIENELNN